MIGAGQLKMAFDLRTRTQIKLSGELTTDDLEVSYCFQGNDRVVAVSSFAAKESGTFSFPAGKRIQQMTLSEPYMEATSLAGYVLTEGPKDTRIGVVDLNTGKYIMTALKPTLDLYDQSYVIENLDGTLGLAPYRINGPGKTELVTLSLSPLGSSTSMELSPDGRYLAYSGYTRGTVWDLTTGRAAIVARGFRGAWWTPEDHLLGDFQALAKEPRTVRDISMKPPHATDMTYKLSDQAHLENGHLVEWKQEKNVWSFQASSPLDGSVQWTRLFQNDRPDYTTNYADTDLILSYTLKSTPAKTLLKGEPKLAAQAAGLKEKDAGRLLEIIGSGDGKTRAMVVVELPRSYDTVDGLSRAGDLIYLSTGDNRTLVYSLETGKQLRQIFGQLIAADATSGHVCAVNRRDEAIVLDHEGHELVHLALGKPARYATLREHGSLLVVLTADQTIHRYRIPEGEASSGKNGEQARDARP